MSGQSLLLSQSQSSPGTRSGYWVEGDGTAHEQCRVLIILGSRGLGEFAFDPGEWPTLRFRREGVAYFCSICGDVWARLVLLDHQGRAKPFEARSVSCEKHWDQWNVSGSLLAGELETLIDLLPPEALRRELLVHLRTKGEGE